jgi:hypothetical protein
VELRPRLGYYDNYLVDNRSCVIVGVQATAARMSQEIVAAQDMIARFAEWPGRDPESVVADATYGNGEFLQWLMERGITPYMRTRDSALRKNNPLYGPERFTFLPESNSYLCPAGQRLNFVGLNVRNRTHAYIGSRKRCGAPRHGKSLTASCVFPAWYLGRNPKRSVIAASYGAELAEDFGRRVRNFMRCLRLWVG